MELDDDVCYCYHVSLRKLVNFARRERPKHPAQMSECLGAGTGCGWCIPTLCRIAEAAQRGEDFRLDLSAAEYAGQRSQYRAERRTRHQFDSPTTADSPPASPKSPSIQDGLPPIENGPPPAI